MTFKYTDDIKKNMVWSSVKGTPIFLNIKNIELCVINNLLITRKHGLIYISRTIGMNFSKKMYNISELDYEQVKNKLDKMKFDSSGLTLSKFSDLVLSNIDFSKFNNVEVLSWANPHLIKYIE